MKKIEFQHGERIPNTMLCYLEEAERTHPKRRRAKFRCDCGNEITTDLNWVRFKNISSCGCYKSQKIAEKNTKHGQAARGKASGAYRSFQAMHQRTASHPLYKDRQVCDRWCGDKGFENFYADMGDRPEGLTIERINNDKGYSPENCKWATYQEQSWNKSTNRKEVDHV